MFKWYDDNICDHISKVDKKIAMKLIEPLANGIRTVH